MPDDLFFVDYTVEAIEDSLNIKDFILIKFTPREVDNFYTLLERFEKVIVLFPLMYPKSLRKSQIHRAVLSKQLSIFYTVSGQIITVVGMIDNRMDYSRWP